VNSGYSVGTEVNAMKIIIKLFLLSSFLALPGATYAQAPGALKAAGDMNCPMMENSGAMQKNMGAMMMDMNAMMASTSDPAMKERMGKMHSQMATMMARMQKMSGGMGGMMSGPAMHGGHEADSTSSAPPASAKDHDAHHPR
jgi:hypothetical protein